MFKYIKSASPETTPYYYDGFCQEKLKKFSAESIITVYRALHHFEYCSMLLLLNIRRVEELRPIILLYSII